MVRSIGSVVAGFVAVAVLSLSIDQVLHALGVYPPWGQPMWEVSDNALALAYRCVIAVFGGWFTARLAPSKPMRHVGVLVVIGLLAGTAGAIAAIPMKLGPAWYPIAIAVASPPLTWVGGLYYTRRRTQAVAA